MTFASARGFIQGDNMDDLEDLCVLFVDCIEVSKTNIDWYWYYYIMHLITLW